MPVFESRSELHQCFGTLFAKFIDKVVLEGKLTDEMSLRFTISDPDTSLSVIANRETQKILFDDDIKTTIELLLTADMAHQMLLGNVSMTSALQKGFIKARGPLLKILKIVPYLKILQEVYPDHYKKFIQKQ